VKRANEPRAWLRPLALWAALLVAGLVLLYGRYDWDLEGGEVAERGFWLSAYLFVLLIPTCFYLLRRVTHDDVFAGVVTGAVFLVFTLPYEALGLDDAYYYADRLPYFTIDHFPPSLEFFPDGALRAFPWDWLFMPLLFLGGTGIVWGLWKIRERAGFKSPRAIPILLTAAFAAICLQTFLHSSMRSPYTYLGHYQEPTKVERELAEEADQEAPIERWYHVYHFDDGSGATEADQFSFTALEKIVQGAPDANEGNNMLIRRPFSFYVASQFSYFTNTFYPWLALNCLLWLAAVFATARLVSQWATPRAGLIAGALTAVGPGFVAFAATPAMYLQGYAAIAIALCLFEDLVVRNRGSSAGPIVLFTAALTLLALIYDMTPFLFVLLAYGLARKVRAGPLVASLAGAFVLTAGFTFVYSNVLGVDINPANADRIPQAFSDVKDFLLEPSIHSWYDAGAQIPGVYARLVLQAFFVLPVVLALFGLPKLKDRALQVLAAAFFLMGLAIIAAFQISDQKDLEELPRLVYRIFPAVYLLAAIALDSFSLPRPATAGSWIPNRVRTAAPWVAVGLLFIAANIDIFGYPTLYVEFFISDPPVGYSPSFGP
jgi:hypothetical protein